MSLNVLVVDDSAVMRKIIIKTLRLAALPIGEVHEASDGREGLDALDAHWIDIVLADINMPVMNGEEMIERMRARPDSSDIPVIVISTEGSKTRIERLEQSGASFVKKPFTAETLRDVVKAITEVSDERPA